MKKLLVATVVLLSFASCKKEWTCECNILGFQVSDKTEKMSKADAKVECEDKSNGMCKLK